MYFLLWTKRSQEYINFDTFRCSGENLPNSSCNFKKPQVSFISNFAWLFSVMKDNSSGLFQVKRYIFWIKGTNQSGNFQAFECSEVNSNSEVILKKQTVFSSNFASFLSVMRNNTAVFFYLKFIYFQKREPIKVQIWWNRKPEMWDFDGLLL